MILLQMASSLAQIPKCRLANNSCCASLGYVQDLIEESQRELSQSKLSANNALLIGPPEDNWLALLAQLLEQGVSDPTKEKEVLTLIQLLYMEESEEKHNTWEEKAWKVLCNFPTKSPVTKDIINCLFRLTFPHHVGGPGGSRLR